MNSRKKYIRIALGAVAAYAAIIALLLIAESNSPESSIRSIGDAIWYSIITLTTVGYGDLSPVTSAGRILGVILALCSLGLLTALIGILMSFISGQAMPGMQLRSSRNRKWYVFSDENEQAVSLAKSALAEAPDARIIFCRSKEKLLTGHETVRIDCGPEDLISLKGSSRDILYFSIGKDSWDNYRQASAAADLGISTYCLTDIESDDFGGSLHTFSRKEIISRCYWRDYPLQRNEKHIVLIGSGSIAAEMLEQGLLTNVFEPGRYVSYHIFGDSSGFRKSHPQIVKALSGGNDDTLILYDDSWEDQPDIIRRADRIIICEDDDQSDLIVYRELSKYFPSAASVHVRLDSELDQITTFGSCGSVFALRTFIRDDINRLAMTLNDIYNEGSGYAADWNDLSSHLKRSNITAADHMIVKIRFLTGDDSITELTAENCRRAYELFKAADPQLRDTCREMEHRRWVRFHQMYNWEYSPVRDNLMRKHPLMLPYSELSEEDKEKDAYAWEMLGSVADRSADS